MEEKLALTEDIVTRTDKRIYGRKNDRVEIQSIYKGYGGAFFYRVKNLDKPADFPPFDVPEKSLKRI